MTKKDRYRRMLVTSGLVAALAAALACGCSGRESVDNAVDSGGPLVSEEGQIAFTHATKFNWTNWASSEADIFLINVVGSGERRLTDSPRLDGFPAWSSDGERLAFSSARDGGQSEMYVMNADGSEQRRLTHTPETESFFSWSPDGERIAYTAYYGKRPYLAVMNADGSEQRRLGDDSLIRRLTGTAAREEQPVWSPDGQKIAYSSEDEGEIYAMKEDGSGRIRLTDTPGYDHWPPAWSPDGTRIALTTENKKRTEVYVINSDGSDLTRLTEDLGEDFYPAWRP